MSPLSKVEMSPATQFEVPAIPSCGIILHRVQPSRLPSGAQDAALTAPVRDAQGYSQMREWRALLWLFRARGDISTLPARGTFLLCRDRGHFYFAREGDISTLPRNCGETS